MKGDGALKRSWNLVELAFGKHIGRMGCFLSFVSITWGMDQDMVWHDPWRRDRPLNESFLDFLNIVCNKDAQLADNINILKELFSEIYLLLDIQDWEIELVWHFQNSCTCSDWDKVEKIVYGGSLPSKASLKLSCIIKHYLFQTFPIFKGRVYGKSMCLKKYHSGGLVLPMQQ